MHTVELLERLVRLAEQLGYQTREEWLGGSGGGRCEFSGKKWIFLDLAVSKAEQLEQLCTALRQDPAVHLLDVEPPLCHLLDLPRAA